MAGRFLIHIDRAAAPSATAIAAIDDAVDLAQVFKSDRVTVWASPDMPHRPLPDGSGCLIGHVFARDGEIFAPRSAQAATTLSGTPASALTRTAWGAYVAVWDHRDPICGATLGRVSRDPGGALPCYYRDHGASVVFASDVDTLLAAGGPSPTVDWAALHRFLYANGLPQPATALAGIVELLGGFEAHIERHEVRPVEIWSPWAYTQLGMSRSLAATADDLRGRVLACTQAWARCFKHLLIGVSGGLDSSIVAAAAAQATPAFTCLTLVTPDALGDERAYARQLTDHLGVELREAYYDLARVDVRQCSSRHLPRPLGQTTSQAFVDAHSRVADAVGADAYLSGIGGDNVFCLLSSTTPVVDRWRYGGLHPGLWATIKDLRALHDCSYGEVIRQAWTRTRTRDPHYIWPAQTDLLHPDRDTPMPTHPWLSCPKGALPGKAVHVAMLLRLQSTLDAGFARLHRLTPVYPLLSQPVVELCLDVPTWLWFEGGRNRAVARAAFAAALPAALINRRSKGGPTGFAFDLVARHLPFLREALLDGLLASHEVIDREAVAAALQSPDTMPQGVRMRLTALLEAELWAQSWSSRRPSAHRVATLV